MKIFVYALQKKPKTIKCWIYLTKFEQFKQKKSRWHKLFK